MLERLGARPVVGGDDEHRRIDLAGPDEHVADQPVVAGHVDEVDRRSRRAGSDGRSPTSIVIPRRRSSGSRSASMPVSARSSVVLPWSMWPAVPMTTVIAPTRALARWPRRGPRPASASTVRRSSTTGRPRSGRRRSGRRAGAPPASRLAERPGMRQAGRRQRLAGQRAAADRRRAAPRPGVAVAQPRREGRRLAPRARRPARRASARPGSRSSARPARYSPRVARQPGHRDLVRAHRAGQRVLAAAAPRGRRGRR